MTGTATASATIENVAPSLDPLAGTTLLQGEEYSAAGAFTDPGADVWTAIVDYGDGFGSQPLSGMSFTLSHTYPQPGTYTVQVAVNDQDGGTGSAQAAVVVHSPQDAVAEFSAALNDLVASGVLPVALANALDSKLKSALLQLDAGNRLAASRELGAFINQGNALLLAGTLSPEQAQELISAANRVIRTIRLF